MKTSSIFFIVTILIAGMFACTEDNPLQEPFQDSDDAVYMKLKLELPDSHPTRSTTDDQDMTNSNAVPDYEIGSEHENAIQSLQVFLTDGQGVIFAKSIGSGGITGSYEDGYVVKFKSSDLLDKTSDSETTDVRIFVFCNPTEEIKGFVGTNTLDMLTIAVNDHNNASIWGSGGFLMSNANDEDWAGSLPKRHELMNYNSSENPYMLHDNRRPILVERACARFDYAPFNNNEYLLNSSEGIDNIQVTLEEMALLNLSKEFYALRRVSKDSTANPITLCGPETPTNGDTPYVVDTDWAEKGVYTGTGLEAHFYFSTEADIISNVENLTWTKIDSLDVNDQWNGGQETEDNKYKVWRYASENTIPGINKQLNGITTGIVFKGKITPISETGNISSAMDQGKTIYVYQNKLYGDWDNVKRHATGGGENEPDMALNAIVQAIEAGAPDGEDKEAAIAAAARESGHFVVYEAKQIENEWHYEVYYYYWNKHNDNKSASMGPMEFAVVRNNVYKLQVTDIQKYGMPEQEPLKPGDKDEDETLYFQLSVKVLPWIVRTNDIIL